MTAADRIYRLNRWYDDAPEGWRFQLVVWGLVALAALNMLLTIAVRFPFGLLLLLAIIVLTAIRLPYALGWLKPAEGAAEGGAEGGAEGAAPRDARFEIEPPDWVLKLNRWYDSHSEFGRMAIMLGTVVVIGAINMALTLGNGFPFGLLVLVGLLALIAIRAPYAAGWFREPEPAQDRIGGPASETARIGQDASATMAAGLRPEADKGDMPRRSGTGADSTPGA